MLKTKLKLNAPLWPRKINKNITQKFPSSYYRCVDDDDDDGEESFLVCLLTLDDGSSFKRIKASFVRCHRQICDEAKNSFQRFAKRIIKKCKKQNQQQISARREMKMTSASTIIKSFSPITTVREPRHESLTSVVLLDLWDVKILCSAIT